MNTTEHKQGKEKLRESEKKYRQLVETLQEGICIIDKKGHTTFINSSMAEMLGYTVEEMQGKHLFLFMDEHGVDLTKQWLEQCKQGIKEQHEFEFIKKDGTKISTLIRTSPLTDKDGNYIGAFVDVRNITERKKAEEQIKNSEERYKNLIELAPDSIMTMDLKGYITSCNSAATRIFRYSKDELIGKHFSKIGILHVKDISKYLKVFVSVLRGTGIGTYELTVKDKDGISHIVESHVSPIKKNNKISGVLVITRDITERKKSEAVLKESQEMYHLIAENSNDLIIITNMDKTFHYVSPSIKSLGYNPDELVGQDSFFIRHPEDKISITPMLKQLTIGMYKQGVSSRFEYRLRDKSGVYHIYEARVKLVKDESGEYRLLSISRDITEHKKKDREINEQREILQNIFNNIPVMITYFDETGKIKLVNNELVKKLGWTFEEWKTENILAKCYPEPEAFKEAADFMTSKSIGWKDFQTTTKYGTVTDTTWTNILLPNGISMGIGRDITEHKKAEEEIKNLAKFPSENPNPVLRITKDGTVVYSNKAGFQILDFWKTNIGEEIPERWRNIIRKKSVSKDLKEEEEEVNDKIFSFVVAPVADEGYVNLYGRDVTEHKKVEDEVKKERDFSKAIINTTQAILLILDTDGKIISFNPYMKKLTGYALSELKGKDWFTTFLQKCDYDHIRNLFKKAILDIQTSGNINSIIAKDGHELIIEWFDKTLRDKDGKITGLLAIGRDITEHKKLEDVLKKSEEKYRILFNYVPVGISITDENGRILDCNRYMGEMFRMTCEEFKANNIKSFYINPKDRERLQNLLNKEGRVVDWECSFKRKNGTAFFAVLNADVIKREGQKLNLTSLRDITERKVAEEKIKRQNVQLKKLDGIKTDFLNTTSHELRTPVASIKGYIQMLLKQTLGEITEEQKKALEVLLRNTNRLDHLIQDILDISRLESGTMKFITEKTDATKMIKEIAETMQASADLKRIKIKIDIQGRIPDLLIDSERIKQVLLNLVDNAIKFSPDGSMIHIKARKEKEDVLFEVQDFGRGIPKNKQKKIFERFYQADSSIDRKFGGVGLGLTISKKIIDTYGGQISVDSTVGKGSSFKFTLPLKSTKNIEDDLQEIYMERP